jgi:4-amino-4-deoxy-L-arabinose transferase-like glycosyltransferase
VPVSVSEFPASSPRRRTILWAGAGVLAAAYAALAAFHVAYGSMNVDEGFYAAAARAVWQGEMPYRDFGFTQPPLVAYVNAPALALTGFGLFQQRAVNGVWGALAILLAARLVRRRAGAGAALTLAAIFTLTSGWLYFVHLGKTYGLTSLLVMGMATGYVELKSSWRKSTLLSVLAVLGVACRLPAAPFFGLLWLAALWDGDRPTTRGVVIALAALIFSAAAVFLPFVIAAPEQTRFWIYDFHRISVPQKDWHVQWNDLVGLAPAVWLAAIMAAGFRAFARSSWKQPEIAVAAAALVALAANLLPGGTYQEYGVPFLLPLAASSLILLEPAVSTFPAWRRFLVTGALLLTSVALIPAIDWSKLVPEQRQFLSALLPLSVPPYDFALPESIAAARTTVQRWLPPGQPFVGPATMLAVEADRPIPRRYRMGAFTCTLDYDAAKADRLHLATFPEFMQQVRDLGVPIVGFYTETKFNYAWSVPSLEFQPPEAFDSLHLLLLRDFVIAHSDRNFVVVVRHASLPTGLR